jgi:molybdopterin molybdotransferase
MLRELGQELVSLESVRETILASFEPASAEELPLAEAHGRVLREDVVARESLPPFDNSAMDGFAVRGADIEAATDERPVTLQVRGGISAGDPGGFCLAPGSAIRIMTGAPVPPGAEAVVPHELTRWDQDQVSFFRPASKGQNIRAAGGDLRPGDVPLRSGVNLRGPQLAIAASLGYSRLRVTRPIRAAILSPGNELVDAGALPGPGKIRNSNAYSLLGLLLEAGVEPINLGILPDRKEEISAAIERALQLGADAILSTGGVSAGDFDFVQAVVREEAKPGYVFKVAMRPGKPQVFGLFRGKPFFGLPGNPAASIVSFEIFVRPALRKLRGESRVLQAPFGVRFPFQYRYKPGRVFLLRARVEPDDSPRGSPRGGFRVVPPGGQDSSFLSSLADANVLITLPANGDRVEADEVHPAIWLGGRES